MDMAIANNWDNTMGRRGRKAKTGIRREANGRLSRRPGDVARRLHDAMDREEREMIGVGIEARARVLGVRPEQCRDQMAGSFVGRLRLHDELSEPQYEAAISYIEDVEAYNVAMHGPRPPGAINLNATHGRVNRPEDVERTRVIRARMAAARKAVQTAQNELRGTANLWAALDLCIVEDRPLTHLVGDLKLALNALARHYRTDN